MKICFISGQKESKRCGITDYVELLAQELEKLGYQIVLHFMKKDCKEFNELPDADLYSIQFAPYAFATNGLPYQILKYLAKKLQYQKIHLNFHEIWVGAYPGANLKERGIGWIQKKQILSFVKKCKPIWISSSNAASINRLKLAGIPAEFLYLFGNIPYSATSKVKTSVQTIKIAFFGTLYADFPYHNLGVFFSNISKICNKQL